MAERAQVAHPVVVSGVALLTVVVAVFLLFQHPPTPGSWWPRCPFHVLTGLHCPGCGVTRAAWHGLQGDLWMSLRHNALAVVALPWVAAGLIARALGRPWRLPGWSARVSLVVVLSFFVLRNVPVSPFDLLAPP